MTSNFAACQSIKNKITNLTLEAQSSTSTISFQFSIRSTSLSQLCFDYVHTNQLGFRILIPSSKSVVMSMIPHILFTTTSNSCLLISIAFCCAFAIANTSMDYYISTCTYVDSCIFASVTFSSPTFFCTIYVPHLCLLPILQ